ncbi:MAG TPA: MerR family transcriptional regulator [Magnetospirillaceae bacterium]|nr:MerR family transcriptional regulator [Magnetospirillaceae bacterium]
MKISELAKATDTKVSTIKFYVKEGLVLPASKTSPNMAYYHRDCVARVQLIKSLQKDHYYPLSVIKHMLAVSETDPTEIALLDAIHKADARSTGQTYSFSEAAKMARLSKGQIEELVAAEVVKPAGSGKKQWLAESDLQVLLLVRRRLDAGIPFEESTASFRIYQESLKSAVKSDVDIFIAQTLLACAPSREDTIRMIGVSDETLDLFINLKRRELNREFGSARLKDLDRFASGLSLFLRSMGGILEELGYRGLSERCRSALLACPLNADAVSSALKHFHKVINSASGSLAVSISACWQAHTYFVSLRPEDAPGSFETQLLYCLKLSWLNLVPSILDSAEESRKTFDSFRSFATKLNDSGSVTVLGWILPEIARIR